jgi:AcrR family transcriptional regulator
MEHTKLRLAEAALELTASGEMAELSMPLVAQRAGVSVPTIYRHFPTHESMFEAVAKLARDRLGISALPVEAKLFPDYVRSLFATFDRNEGFMRSRLTTQLGREAHSRGQQERATGVSECISRMGAKLSPREIAMTAGAVRVLMSASAWQTLRDNFGLSGEDAGRAAAWAIETLLDNLHRLPQENDK